MKVVILAGGQGSRLSEETVLRPKPMVEIGGKPMLWHIMNIYSAHNINEFVVAAGYKAEFIKEYFLNFYEFNSDLTIDLTTGKKEVHNGNPPPWKVHLVDTGQMTQTGGRLKRVSHWLRDEETFMFTYGDGVANVDINALLEYHHAHGKLATVTTVKPPSRFGRIHFEGNQIFKFHEKPELTDGWISGGFFVLNRSVLEYIQDDETVWEREPIERLSADGQLMGFRHEVFWSPMDTIYEKNTLEAMWSSGKAPWKMWE